MIAPIVPGINSDEMPALIKQAANAGARWASYTIVRLNGAIAQIFTDWVDKNYPDRADKIIHGIEACHGGKLNASQWGRGIGGGGETAAGIRRLFDIAVTKHMNGPAGSPLRTDLFTWRDRDGELKLI